MILLGTKKFYNKLQKKFIDFSGDKNPIHLCQNYSRKTIYGQILVHGIHAVLWSLELLTRKKIYFNNLDIRFLRPIFLKEKIFFYWNNKNNEIIIKNANAVLCKIIITKTKKVEKSADLLILNKTLETPSDKTIKDIEKLKCKKKNLSYKSVSEKIENSFSNLEKIYGLSFVYEVSTLSYIVGMEVPGLNSLFVSTKIKLKSNNKLLKRSYSVSYIEKRVGLVNLNFFGKTIESNIQTILRQNPVKNPSIRRIKKFIKKKEFSHMNALVIGGSRGIGEIVSKIITLGGGKVTFTYYKGYEEAKKIKKEFNKKLSKNISDTEVDILNQGHLNKLKKMENINYIFYFASPKILKSWNKKHDNQIYKIYKLYFFQQFKKIVKTFNENKNKLLFFYPSTVFIEKKIDGYQSYIKSKLLGENFCKKNINKNFNFYYPRLPMLVTDQNQSFFKLDPISNIPILLKYLRKI